ncbi:MAG: AAA family ATPase, partial [Chloroflexi bacterium]|nr:AAA family ATPase [Chloroflexota bacterium]
METTNLKVSEALAKDVGRGIARIDPAVMVTMSAEVGDIVHIAGKRSTVAKLMPTYTEDRGKGIIQIDGIIRE